MKILINGKWEELTKDNAPKFNYEYYIKDLLKPYGHPNSSWGERPNVCEFNISAFFYSIKRNAEHSLNPLSKEEIDDAIKLYIKTYVLSTASDKDIELLKRCLSNGVSSPPMDAIPEYVPYLEKMMLARTLLK